MEVMLQTINEGTNGGKGPADTAIRATRTSSRAVLYLSRPLVGRIF